MNDNPTPNSRIKGWLRQMFMRSNERAEAFKRDKYTCQRCGAKKSVKKGFEVKCECHHKEGIMNWDELIQMVRDKLLVDPDKLETLCKECHKKETYG